MVNTLKLSPQKQLLILISCIQRYAICSQALTVKDCDCNVLLSVECSVSNG